MSKLLETKNIKTWYCWESARRWSLLSEVCIILPGPEVPLSPATQHYGLRMIVFLSRVAAQLITAKNIYPIPCCQVDPWLHNCFLHVVLILGWSQLTLFLIKEPPFDCQYVFAIRQKKIFMVIWQQSRQIENFKTDLHKNVYFYL